MANTCMQRCVHRYSSTDFGGLEATYVSLCAKSVDIFLCTAIYPFDDISIS